MLLCCYLLMEKLDCILEQLCSAAVVHGPEWYVTQLAELLPGLGEVCRVSHPLPPHAVHTEVMTSGAIQPGSISQGELRDPDPRPSSSLGQVPCPSSSHGGWEESPSQVGPGQKGGVPFHLQACSGSGTGFGGGAVKNCQNGRGPLLQGGHGHRRTKQRSGG